VLWAILFALITYRNINTIKIQLNLACPLGFRYVKVKVKVTLQLTVGQSVCFGVEPQLALMTRYFFL
jgi:hypothetical protein